MTTERFQVWKAHGLGNDYLVWESPSCPLNGERAGLVCHRNIGAGGDGILEPSSTTRADYGLRIWNPDGSVAEKSGNGLRIYAWWLYTKKSASRSFSIDTGPDVVRATVLGDGLVKVEMGAPTFSPEQIPSRKEIWGEPWFGGLAYAVGMGNPHCVVLFEDQDLDALGWRTWGAQLERDSRFPNRANVQFVRPLSSSSFELRIWERGAGETLASGSSSCAVFAVLRRLGRVEDKVISKMQGGELELSMRDGIISLCGPVSEVGQIELSSAMSMKLMEL